MAIFLGKMWEQCGKNVDIYRIKINPHQPLNEFVCATRSAETLPAAFVHRRRAEPHAAEGGRAAGGAAHCGNAAGPVGHGYGATAGPKGGGMEI